MHLIKASMLFMSTSLVAVQGMRIDFKIDLPNDVNPRRLRPINKFKTAITPEHPLPSLSDPEFDLELVIQASKAVHVSLEDVQSGEGKWSHVLDAITRWSLSIESAEGDLGYHEETRLTEESMKTIGDMTCSNAEDDAVREGIINRLAFSKEEWGKWVGKFKSSCIKPEYEASASKLIGKEQGNIGKAIDDLSACNKEANIGSKWFQIPMEMK